MRQASLREAPQRALFQRQDKGLLLLAHFPVTPTSLPCSSCRGDFISGHGHVNCSQEVPCSQRPGKREGKNNPNPWTQPGATRLLDLTAGGRMAWRRHPAIVPDPTWPLSEATGLPVLGHQLPVWGLKFIFPASGNAFRGPIPSEAFDLQERPRK